MDRTRAPRHRASVPPRRAIAVAGAVAVTTLAVSGSLGLVPGVALGETPAHRDVDPEGARGSTVDDAAPVAPPTSDFAPAQPRSEGNGTAPDSTDSTDSPQPAGSALPERSGSGQRIVYDISGQRVWLVRADDSVARTYLVSGALDASKVAPGRYQVFSKSRNAVAFDYEETMQHMVRFAHGDSVAIGFHDIPRDLDGDPVQTREQLGTPLSAGCIRQWRPDAVALWRFSEVGTPVVVVA